MNFTFVILVPLIEIQKMFDEMSNMLLAKYFDYLYGDVGYWLRSII